jgi:hypothetical protein
MRTDTFPDPEFLWTEAEAVCALEQWRRSGERLAVFARRHGITAGRLHWWKKRLANAESESSSEITRALTLVPAAVVPTSNTRGAAVVIRVRDEIVIEVAEASPSWVAAVVVALERAQP